ncbi:MAG: threonyl-tRNA synthetase editing domain-containing protein [bacterium]
MRLLTFQARRFTWQPASQTLSDADPSPAPGAADDAVVAWLHVEARDATDEARVFRHVLKHLKWIANKRDLQAIVLHSFAHLGGETADPAFAHALLLRLAERLTETGYAVQITPFGWFCAWSLDVHGDSLAKVYKEV